MSTTAASIGSILRFFKITISLAQKQLPDKDSPVVERLATSEATLARVKNVAMRVSPPGKRITVSMLSLSTSTGGATGR